MTRREILRELHAAAIAAVEPRAAVHRHCRRMGDTLEIDGQGIDLRAYAHLYIIGAGKASAPMAAAIEELLGDRITAGLVVVKEGHTCPLAHIKLVEARHPVPDERGLAAAEDLLTMVTEAGADDLIINCLSGGASALLPAPRPPMTLADKQALTDALLASGAPIDQLNVVRRHVSRLKGGGLARAAAPARLINLIISDVVGDQLETIGSGPGVPDPSILEEARACVQSLGEQIPAPVHAVLADPASETPKPGDPCFARVAHHLIASNSQAQAALSALAEERGLAIEPWGEWITGEAADRAIGFVERARQLQSEITRPTVLLAGGETTVTLSGFPGRGGRCQTFALAAARELAGHDLRGITILAAGTDGNDGPTDACGAFADRRTWARICSHHLEPSENLRRNDEYPALDAADELFFTGPTNTNVMDLYCALVLPELA